jgi:hypothetical protein
MFHQQSYGFKNELELKSYIYLLYSNIEKIFNNLNNYEELELISFFKNKILIVKYILNSLNKYEFLINEYNNILHILNTIVNKIKSKIN